MLRARELEFVQAARALGATTPRILARHVIPTTLPAVTVQATLGMGGAILAEAALSFLGLGVQPPTPSWGTMLNYGRAHLLDAPHLTIFPGLAIAMLVLGFNFLGDGLRDALDPATQGEPTRSDRSSKLGEVESGEVESRDSSRTWRLRTVRSARHFRPACGVSLSRSACVASAPVRSLSAGSQRPVRSRVATAARSRCAASAR